MELKEMEAALEAVLFAAGEPVGVERLCLGLETDRPTLDAVAQRLMDQYSYERRGIRLLRLDASYQLCSAPEYADYVRKTLESRKPARLSQPALEVLAIIAYYQPVTRAYVDQVRGVDSSYTVGLLLERDLIEESGRLAVPGRPILYRTTKTFLRSFGLSSLEELPELPSGTQEGDQMTLKLEEAVAKLKAEEAGEVPEGETPILQDKLRCLTEGRALRCGVSDRFSDLNERGGYRRQAMGALTLAALPGSGRMRTARDSYQELMLAGALAQVGPTVLELSEVRALAEYDERNHTEYLDTLEKYLAFGNRLSGAAASMFIDRSTMKYRLQKIGDLLGADTDDPAAARRLQLAIAVHRLRGKLAATEG